MLPTLGLVMAGWCPSAGMTDSVSAERVCEEVGALCLGMTYVVAGRSSRKPEEAGALGAALEIGAIVPELV